MTLLPTARLTGRPGTTMSNRNQRRSTSGSSWKQSRTAGTIELHVNSNGGSVKEGVAIYNQLKQHQAEKICYVDGLAYSVASVICMACDKIIMGQGTSMLIHNMAMAVCGDAKTLRKCADDLDVLMESNRQIYMERAKNLTEDELNGDDGQGNLPDAGTVPGIWLL